MYCADVGVYCVVVKAYLCILLLYFALMCTAAYFLI